MLFSDLALSRRLEGAEGNACAQFAEARRRLFPSSGAEWISCDGVYVVFDGINSPATQTFGLGLFDEPSHDSLSAIERFFLERGAPVHHEVSPFAGVPTLELLCARGYRPIEISNVLHRSTERLIPKHGSDITVHVAGPNEEELWTQVSARGWGHEHPELAEFLRESGLQSSARHQTISFLAEIEGQPGAAAALCLHERVALFGGAATIPELRCRGLQSALLDERMRYAFDHGCDLAMMVAEAGSNSQRNAERKGFQVAYTRLKWRLSIS